MKKLPLHQAHISLNAKMGEFAGYDMPLYYTKPIEEHHKVRNETGVFDISHMGQFVVKGPDAENYLQYTLANDIKTMKEGEARYSPLCGSNGGVLDDLILYRYTPEHYRVIVNSATYEKDLAWMQSLLKGFDATLKDHSPDLGLLAIQGPETFNRLRPHLTPLPENLGYYQFAEVSLFGVPVFLARTGYTGEPGLEVSASKEHLPMIWKKLTEELNIAPIGLAARDTLRLEAAMALYGHELKEEWTPLESGIAWAVKTDVAEDFVGKTEIVKAKTKGLSHAIVGLEVTNRGIPRADYPVMFDKRQIGVVTSGALSPTTGKSIALAHVAVEHTKVGTRLMVEIRGKEVEVMVVKRPFYRNPTIKEGSF